MSPEFYGLDIIVASNIGTLKHFKYNSNPKKKQHTKQLQNIKELTKGQGITCMSWIDPEQTKFIIGRQNRTIQTYDLSSEAFTDTIDVDFGKGKLQSVSVFGESIMGAVESGVIKVWKPNSSEQFILDTSAQLEKMQHCPYNTSIVASGGKENDLVLWDLEEKEPIFCAKNVPHDWLQLRVPIWVSDICFLPEESGKVVACCSRYGTVRLYDARAQRRPVCNVEFKDQAASCISLGHYDKHVLVGTGKGVLNLVDLRMKGKLSKMYKGATGAITQVNCLKDKNIVISTSLDRHMRIHDCETKAMIHKYYLTSKLSCFLLRSVDSFIKPEIDENITIKEEKDDDLLKEEEIDQEYDDLFDNMEVISETTNKKEKKASSKNVEEIISNDEIKDKTKKRKITNNNEVSNTDKLVTPKKIKTDEVQEEENEVNLDESIKQLLKSTEKLKRKLLEKKKKKKAKSLFYK